MQIVGSGIPPGVSYSLTLSSVRRQPPAKQWNPSQLFVRVRMVASGVYFTFRAEFGDIFAGRANAAEWTLLASSMAV